MARAKRGWLPTRIDRGHRRGIWCFALPPLRYSRASSVRPTTECSAAPLRRWLKKGENLSATSPVVILTRRWRSALSHDPSGACLPELGIQPGTADKRRAGNESSKTSAHRTAAASVQDIDTGRPTRQWAPQGEITLLRCRMVLWKTLGELGGRRTQGRGWMLLGRFG